MLTVVPDVAPADAWVQVLGRIAIHTSRGESKRLTGSGQRLISVLVAAGRAGATAERIAEEIWGDDQPNPWRPALRMAVARLRKQLPDGWEIVAEGGTYSITHAAGWIDAWRLNDIASGTEPIVEEDLPWLLAGHPFPDVDLLQLVNGATQHLRILQISVAERFCAQDQTSLTTTSCSLLVDLVSEHPYNDRFAVVVARALTAADRQTQALLLISDFATTYANEFGSVPPDVAGFIATGGSEGLPYASASERTTSVAALPKPLRRLDEQQMFGRDRELAELQDAEGALVTGPIGAGKSRLLTALIASDPSVATTYVVGDDLLEFPLGPFAVAMPGLRDELVASLPAGHTEGHADVLTGREMATRTWPIVLGYLEARALSTPQRLVVDDAHLLGPASLGLLRLLIRTTTTSDITLVVCGRNDIEDVEWTALRRDAERAGLLPVDLQGLSEEVLRDMVYREFPDATIEARHGLASDVFEASGGLPVVAAPLIASADPTLLALPEQLEGSSALTRVIANVAESSREVVAAAAVLGHRFSVGALAAIAEVDEAVTFGVLDELWSAGLIVETDDPDQVQFRHVLVQRAFLEGVPLFRRGQLHFRAAARVTDPHRRAGHLASAGALVEPDVAQEALCESARLYAARSRWRDVSRELRRADELSETELDVESLILWATALDRSGADGSAPRRIAFDRAATASDWTFALDAALSGLPEAEVPDGDLERIEMLEAIPEAELPMSRRFERVFHLSRQYGLVGVHDAVLGYANEALLLAQTADDAAASHECRWLATRHVTPQTHPIPVELLHLGSLRVRTRLAHINLVNLAESGDFKSARTEASRFAALAHELAHPLRIWQSHGIEGTFLTNAGQFELAEELALQARSFADLHDIRGGWAVYVGQLIHRYDMENRLAELDLQPYRSNLSTAILGRAALALWDHQRGVEGVEEEVQSIVAAALSQLSSFALTSVVVLARLLPTHAPELVVPTRELLAKYGDSPMLASFGVGSYAPMTRYVAQLTADPDERSRLVTSAIAAADSHGQLAWQVQTRLDAADLGLVDALTEAKRLASGTGFADVVRRWSKSAERKPT